MMDPASDVLIMNNPFTRSIANSPGDFSTEKMLSLNQYNSVEQGAYEDYYNCWGSAISGSLGKEITRGVGINTSSQFDAKLLVYYKAIEESEIKFGTTVIRFADDNNIAQHGAVYYGTSKNGTIYIYTKNGWKAKPEIMPLSVLLEKIPEYGTIKGLRHGHSGYYAPR